MKPFADRLAEAVRRTAAPVVVGLDPRLEGLPPALAPEERSPQTVASAFERFCREVIDAVACLVPAVKPQAAFFEQLGPAGMQALANLIAYARQKDLLVILDGKRNDIGSTAAAYADGWLGPGGCSPWGADALTVNAYLGEDAVQPFIETAKVRGAGLFVLVKTSNPGSRQFQDLVADGMPLYQHVGRWVEQIACQSLGQCGYSLVGAVVGATYPAQLAELRSLMPHVWFLVPGYGAQGGTARDVASAFDSQGLGAVVVSARGILFAYQNSPYRERFGPDHWQQAVEAATKDMIAQLRAETPASQLHPPSSS
ncbi:MAG: orotidine-5'-phosphate decarboxylase [Thermoguttaceae bacterium]|nr:orotidine-5'-phosphate decarboxylase [Thermoguttaceae bacterium]MDW8039598.1 orotidine-5'-phosphate decarboxylase [Thermoguttaceae bacterium]